MARSESFACVSAHGSLLIESQVVVRRYWRAASGAKTARRPIIQRTDWTTSSLAGSPRTSARRVSTTTVTGWFLGEDLQPRRHRIDGHEGGAREHQREDRDEPGRLSCFGILRGEADVHAHPGHDEPERHRQGNDPETRPVEPLTPREEEVLIPVARGQTNSEIADALHISLSTVKTHLASLMRKLDARNRVEVAM